MKVTIKVQRSDEWVRAQRIARGENVPETVSVDVETCELSETVRRFLLDYGRGEYRSVTNRFTFNPQYKWNSWNSWSIYGSDMPHIDADAPTAEQINTAILAMDARLTDRRAKHEVDEWQRRVNEEAAEAEKAARQAKIVEARELLAEDIATLTNRADKAEKQRDTLAGFLVKIPDDALRGTLKSLANSRNAIATLQQELENASPEVAIFADDDES